MLRQKWKIVLDRKGYDVAILMNLAKAFGTLNHDFLITKLHAYGFSEESLKLIKTWQIIGKERRSISVSAVGMSFS